MDVLYSWYGIGQDNELWIIKWGAQNPKGNALKENIEVEMRNEHKLRRHATKLWPNVAWNRLQKIYTYMLNILNIVAVLLNKFNLSMYCI